MATPSLEKVSIPVVISTRHNINKKTMDFSGDGVNTSNLVNVVARRQWDLPRVLNLNARSLRSCRYLDFFVRGKTAMVDVVVEWHVLLETH